MENSEITFTIDRPITSHMVNSDVGGWWGLWRGVIDRLTGWMGFTNTPKSSNEYRETFGLFTLRLEERPDVSTVDIKINNGLIYDSNNKKFTSDIRFYKCTPSIEDTFFIVCEYKNIYDVEIDIEHINISKKIKIYSYPPLIDIDCDSTNL